MNLFQKLTSLTRRVVIVLALVGMLGISFSAPAYAATPARFVLETHPPPINSLLNSLMRVRSNKPGIYSMEPRKMKPM
jgi:hypothetical protein